MSGSGKVNFLKTGVNCSFVNQDNESVRVNNSIDQNSRAANNGEIPLDIQFSRNKNIPFQTNQVSAGDFRVGTPNSGDISSNVGKSMPSLTGGGYIPDNDWCSLHTRHNIVYVTKQMESGSTVINLSDGCISAIPTPLPKHVTTIIANNNSLLSLPDDLYESNITYLSVSGNAIKKWPSIWPRGLKELIFDRNPVGHLPDNLPNSVERISGIDCGIVRGLDRYPEKLINLTLSRNKIEVFEIKNIKNLRNLDISLNPLKTCLVDSPESLEMLYMGDTDIVRFNADFSKCINLRGIFLEGCSNLTEFVVVFPDKEVVIDFSGTGITEEYFKSPGYEKLKVDNWGFTS